MAVVADAQHLFRVNIKTEKATNLDPQKRINTTKIMKQSTGRKRDNIFYVVTRNGRRAWPKDYWTIGEAQAHATSLIEALKSFKDKSYKNVTIVETSDPSRIN